MVSHVPLMMPDQSGDQFYRLPSLLVSVMLLPQEHLPGLFFLLAGDGSAPMPRGVSVTNCKIFIPSEV